MIDLFQNWFGYIFDRYQVSPLVFGMIYLASILPCWFCLFKILHSVKRKEKSRIVFWSIIFALFFAAPYAYVYVAGRNYPWWFHVIFGMFVVTSILYMVKKIRKKIIKQEG